MLKNRQHVWTKRCCGSAIAMDRRKCGGVTFFHRLVGLDERLYVGVLRPWDTIEIKPIGFINSWHHCAPLSSFCPANDVKVLVSFINAVYLFRKPCAGLCFLLSFCLSG